MMIKCIFLRLIPFFFFSPIFRISVTHVRRATDIWPVSVRIFVLVSWKNKRIGDDPVRFRISI